MIRETFKIGDWVFMMYARKDGSSGPDVEWGVVDEIIPMNAGFVDVVVSWERCGRMTMVGESLVKA